MAAIGRIRKHGVLLMIIIGVALLAFIVGDLTNIINFGRNTIVQVDGNKVTATPNGDNQYGNYYSQNVALYTRLNAISDANFDPQNPSFLQEMHQLTWDQIKHETLLDEELGELGLGFSDEMTKDAIDQLAMSLMDGSFNNTVAGQYLYLWYDRYVKNYITDPRAFIQFCQQPSELESQSAYVYQALDFGNILKAIQRAYVLQLKENTYFGLAYNSLTYSKNLLNQMAKDNESRTGKVLAINVNNPAFNDLKFEVSDKEAKKYFKEHKSRYYVRETQKDINMIYFPVQPSNADSTAAYNMAVQQYNRLASSASIKEFTSENVKFDKTKLMYRQSDGVYDYDGNRAYFAQLDTTVWLKNNESIMQMENRIYQKSRGFNSYLPINNWALNQKLHPANADSIRDNGLIAPIPLDNFFYFGKVNGIAYRPDSVKMAYIAVEFKTTDNSKAELTEEQAYAEALSIQAAVNGSADTAAFEPYREKYGFKTNDGKRLVPSDWLTDGTFGGDTTVYYLFNKLIAADSNGACIQKANGRYLVALKQEQSKPILKSQYVLYPVPIMASTQTIKSIEKKANELAASSSAADLNQATAIKKGGIFVNASVTNMEHILGSAEYHMNIREVVNWAFNTNDDAGNENGNVASNAFKGSFYRLAQGMDESYQQDGSRHLINMGNVYIVAGITATTDMRKANFKNVIERVKADIIAEKKLEAATARVQKAFTGNNMDALALTYNSAVAELNVSFSEYGNGEIESAAIGKISTIAKGQTKVVNGTNFIYVVSVDNIIPANEVANQRIAQAKTYYMQQGAAENAAANLAATANAQYMRFAAQQTALNRYTDIYGSNVIKRLVYNDMEDDVKIVDHRQRFYGNSEN